MTSLTPTLTPTPARASGDRMAAANTASPVSPTAECPGNSTAENRRSSAAPGRLVGPPFELVVGYAVAMPFLAGIPRGTLVPGLRPSEALQLVVTAVAVLLAAWSAMSGRRWRITLGSLDWWLVAIAVTASIMPILWLAARAHPVGSDELLAAFPFVKYAVLYFLVRGCVRSGGEVELVVRAVVASAAVVSVIAICQALGVGPVIDVLGRFFTSSVEDVVDGGRGTTTIGSSIATGAYLAISCGLSLSFGLATGRIRWLLAAAFLGVGALASGQAGTVVALGVVMMSIAWMYRRTGQLLAWGIPAAVIGLAALSPIVTARLADIDAGTGLPQSWIIRGNNISELYLPSLADGGWVLGVSPDAVVTPPDVFRSTVYLESGYLWLLWVGGVPLLAAVTGFLVSAWRATALDTVTGRVARSGGRLGAGDAVRVAARAAVAMMAVLSLIDPHLTLRAGADLFFILLALALAATPLADPVAAPIGRWRRLLAADSDIDARHPLGRLQLAEAVNQPPSGLEPRLGLPAPAGPGALDRLPGSTGRNAPPELTLSLTARGRGLDIGGATLALHREPDGLRGEVVGAVHGVDREAAGLVWRAVVLAARSLRLIELSAGSASFDRAELTSAARLAEALEIERMAGQRRPQRSSTDRSEPLAEDRLPGIRFDLSPAIPFWKRAIDLGLGLVALVVTAPLWLLSGVLVWRSSEGPVLYRQVRIGTGGLPFQIYKFRTMYRDNDDTAHRLQNRLELRGEADGAKDDADPRVTPIGRLLRRLSLDELPQLLNVMRSEMSLVGPRPSLVWESELFQPPARRRLTVRPGLTGLWQIGGRADVSMSEMLELDLDYVERMGPMADLYCLVKTATSVVAGRGAR